MPGLQDLIRVHVAKEVNWGTGVTATAALMGVKDLSMQPIMEGEVLDDVRGSLGGSPLAVIKKTGATATLQQIATYEDSLYPIESLAGVATPSGAGPYVRNYAAPLTAQVVSPRIMTLYQFNTDASAWYRMLGAVAKKITIKAASNVPLEISTDLIGKGIEPTDATATATSSVNDRTVIPIMGNDHALWIDAVGGTIGTTSITPDAYAMELTLETPRELRYGLGGAAPYTWRDGKWQGSLKLTMEFNAASKAYQDAIIAASSTFQKQVRNKFTNTSFLQLDFAGTAVAAPKIFTNQNGVLTVEFELRRTYNATLANWFKASSSNTVATIA